MNINLTAEQEKFTQFTIKTVKYRSSEEVLETALLSESSLRKDWLKSEI